MSPFPVNRDQQPYYGNNCARGHTCLGFDLQNLSTRDTQLLQDGAAARKHVWTGPACSDLKKKDQPFALDVLWCR